VVQIEEIDLCGLAREFRRSYHLAMIESAPAAIMYRREGALGFICGILIGAAAGMIGVGGGEFRIPVLLHVLRLPVRIAAGANTIIGLAVVVLGSIRRLPQHEWQSGDGTLAGVMVVASLIGAWFGSRMANRVPLTPLKIFVTVYLTIVGIWMIVEAFLHADYALIDPSRNTRLFLGAVVGLAIAAVSGSLGVAGGEMRIPALMYLFAMPIKQAGTISLVVSIPTVAASAVVYRSMGHIPNRVLAVACIMGAGSLIGVLAGAALLPYVDKHVLKGILGAILLLATVCLTLPWLSAPANSSA
jgi:uncharacterized membrane protein YfcA